MKGASALAHVARGVNGAGGMKGALGKTPLWPAVQLERVHQAFLKMNRSGVIFIAALNGSALGLGAEFSWANDLRVMPQGDCFIGQPKSFSGSCPAAEALSACRDSSATTRHSSRFCPARVSLSGP